MISWKAKPRAVTAAQISVRETIKRMPASGAERPGVQRLAPCRERAARRPQGGRDFLGCGRRDAGERPCRS
jgi:hypothetical protein